eukprot:540733_1
MDKEHFTVLYVIFLINICFCHPDPNPMINIKCENPNNITFYSYHIHVLFWQQNNASYTNALALKNEFIKAFNINESAECNDINSTHNQNPPLCIVDFDFPEPACPFLTSEWAAFVPNNNIFSKTVPWMMVNHAKYDMVNVMIHPNSGCEIYDHRNWLFWIGNNVWELDLTCLHWDHPGYNEYDCIQQAQLLMFENNGMNYNEYCGLKTDNTTNHFIEPSKGGDIKFCSTLCQSWIDKLLQFSLDCPYDCDFYTNNNNQEQLCNMYWNSLKDLYNWSLYQCGQ